jgi:lipopolysaccharide transport system permease protein
MAESNLGYFISDSSQVALSRVYSVFMSDLFKSKTIILQLIKRDVYTQFRQQITGVLWIAISPLVSVIGYIIMYTLGILKPGTTAYPYFIFVIVGVGLWSLLAISTSTLANSLVAQSELILRTNVPLIAIPLSSLGKVLLAYLSHIFSVFFLVILFRVPLGPLWYLYPLVSLLPIVYGAGFGIFISIWQVVSREIGALSQVGLQVCFFATPALFSHTLPIDKLGLIFKYNPLSYTILTPRSFLLEQNPLGLLGFGISGCLSLVLLTISIIFFYKKSFVVAERL